MLPTFLIAGGRRCGTTSLYHWMKEHPQIYLFPETDTAFFIEDELVGRVEWLDGKVNVSSWEQTHSIDAYMKRFSDCEGYTAVGEKSADLLYWKNAHPRLARFIPNCKFIIILRNPVNRAWSHYWNERGKGREKLSFEDALAAEEERCTKSDYADHHLSYCRRGFYDISLQSFYSHIPREQILVLIFERLILHPQENLCNIYKFIGVDPNLGLEKIGSRHNENWTMVKYDWVDLPGINKVEQLYHRVVRRVTERLLRGRPDSIVRKRRIYKYVERVFRRPAAKIAMPKEIRSNLTRIYEPHIQRLEKMLGYEIPEWRE